MRGSGVRASYASLVLSVVRGSYARGWNTSLVYEQGLVCEPYTRLVRRPVYAANLLWGCMLRGGRCGIGGLFCTPVRIFVCSVSRWSVL